MIVTVGVVTTTFRGFPGLPSPPPAPVGREGETAPNPSPAEVAGEQPKERFASP